MPGHATANEGRKHRPHAPHHMDVLRVRPLPWCGAPHVRGDHLVSSHASADVAAATTLGSGFTTVAMDPMSSRIGVSLAANAKQLWRGSGRF
jgi:hypothetical protein